MPPFNSGSYVEKDGQGVENDILDGTSDVSRAHIDQDTTLGKRRLLGLGGQVSDYQGPSLTERSAPNYGSYTQTQTHAGIATQQYPTTAEGLTDLDTSSQNFATPDPSSIFERNVQESSLPIDAAPAIPAHIKTEDLIPPALEASSLAITDNHLTPDDVEIVTHAAHQPAAAALPDRGSFGAQSDSQLPLSHHSSQDEVPLTHHDEEETAASYGSLNPNDARRLSFISFADVVQAEHAEQESHLAHRSSSIDQSRAQSPIKFQPPSPSRSPASSLTRNVTTPPAGIDAVSQQGFEVSPNRSPSRSQVSNPMTIPGTQHGDLVMTTMSQALRSPASGDVLTGRNHSTSITSTEDGAGNPLRP
ncbi:hypothetical protein MBLNU457_g0007t1 [Dothideomycetes sp. NU457]